MKAYSERDKDQPRPRHVCVRRMPLDNGAQLEILDASRPMAGDRWQVAVIFRLTFPVIAQMLSGCKTPVSAPEIRKLIGEQAVFEKRLHRTFIDRADKDRIFQQMVDRWLEGSLGYISKPLFARNVVLKQYAEAARKIARTYARKG